MPHLTYQAVADLNFGGVTASATNSTGVTVVPKFSSFGESALPTLWNLVTVSETDPTNPKVIVKTEFDSTQSSYYPPTATVTGSFELTSYNGAVSIGPSTIIFLTLTDPASITSSLMTGSSASPSSMAITQTFQSSANGVSTPVSQTSGLSSSQDTPNTEVSPSSASNHYTLGELAGAAIGCLVAGFLIASLLVFLCLKRRKKSRISPYVSESGFRSSKIDGESVNLATGSPANWQKRLPQPESDQTISRLANRTLDDIELFVENFYADQTMTQMDEGFASDMSLFSSPYLGRAVGDIIQTSDSPTVLLKHCLAYYLLQRIDPMCNDSSSLLPREFAVPSNGDRKIQSQLRVLMAHSRSDIDQDEKYLAQRDRAAQTIMQQVERAFQPWARGNMQDRAKNLKGILTHLGELGNKLFSQPAIFEWRWRRAHMSGQDQIVMLPGLDKMTDSRAVSLVTPICLVEPRLSRFVR